MRRPWQVADAVAVRIRPRPDLFVGEWVDQGMYFLRCFTVVTLKIVDKSGVEVRHGRDSNKIVPALFRIEFCIVH
jgi:hypothetical protein